MDSEKQTLCDIDLDAANHLLNQGRRYLDFCPWPEAIGMDVKVAKYLLKQGHGYLDVRAEKDFKRGHVENALNIPYYLKTPQGRVKNPEFVDQVMKVFGQEDQFFVGCGTGNRSELATTDLLNAKFKYVYNMLGGYKEWAANGFPVNKPNRPVHP